MSEPSFWTQESYDIYNMYTHDIPWVATRSMTVALHNLLRYKTTKYGESYDTSTIYDWMKKIEMQRHAPVWGFTTHMESLFLLNRDIYATPVEDPDLPGSPTEAEINNPDWQSFNHVWDREAFIIAQREPDSIYSMNNDGILPVTFEEWIDEYDDDEEYENEATSVISFVTDLNMPHISLSP